MRKALIVFLSILMIFTVACASQPAEPAQTSQPPPQTQQPAPAQPEQTMEKPAETAGKAVSVAIKGFKFVPADVTVNVGDTVIWTNEDSAPHTVESSDDTLRSDELSKEDTYSYKFTKTGKYDYICGIHPSMKGSVTVQ